MSRSVDAVLLDVGGVLLLPDPVNVRKALGTGDRHPPDSVLDRAHYLATATTDAVGRFDRQVYRQAYARACGVPDDRIPEVVEAMATAVTGYDWRRITPTATRDLHDLTAGDAAVGIVSNSPGAITEMLFDSGVCQVGHGPYAAVETIVDSGVVGIRKPDPRIFHVALEILECSPSSAVYVGDTARIDVDGARLAGMRAVHFDPHEDCPDPRGDHEHVRSLFELTTLLRIHRRSPSY